MSDLVNFPSVILFEDDSIIYEGVEYKKVEENTKQLLSDKEKLLSSLSYVDNLAELLKGNEYEQFFYNHLISLRTELQRQLSHYG